MADRAALVIAIESFFEAGPPIAYAAADCAEIARALPAVGYDPRKCILLSGTRTTKSVIEAHLKRLSKLIDKAERLLVLIVSRGLTLRGHGYIACSDTILTDLAETAISVADLFSALEKTRCREIALLLDIDPLPQVAEMMPTGLHEGELRALFEGSPHSVGLLASAPGERSFESGQLRHGIWRHHLLEALTGRIRSGVVADEALTAAALQAYLADAVPRMLRRTYESPQDQSPLLLGEANAGMVIADLSAVLGPGGELLHPGRMKRIVFRAESAGGVKNLAGYRKSHSLPDRANEWARKYVNRVAAADIKADLDSVFDKVRDEFAYKRKDLDVSAERDGLGFIRTPDFEYTVSVEVNPDDPTEVIWRREIARLAGPEFVRSRGFQTVFGTLFDRLVFEFFLPVNVAELVDRIEEAAPEGVKVGVASDANAAEITLAGFGGKVTVKSDSVIIHGRAGNPATLLEQFLAFLRKFAGLGEPKTFAD